MITVEAISNANKGIDTIEVKGKPYVCVPARISAFRSICPDGSIETEILDMNDGVVTIRAIIKDETGKVLATGTAQEKETSSYINKTSYIENCETSAVGRALGMLGLGITSSIASAEEVANAIANQAPQRSRKEPEIPEVTINASNEFDPISENEKTVLKSLWSKTGRDFDKDFGTGQITRRHYVQALNFLKAGGKK